MSPERFDKAGPNVVPAEGFNHRLGKCDLVSAWKAWFVQRLVPPLILTPAIAV
jgi:hypothetical protein